MITPMRCGRSVVRIDGENASAAVADPSEAKAIVDVVAGQSPRATARKESGCRRVGPIARIKGGKARAAKLSKKRRVEIAQKAASARWKQNRESEP
jgi:hypothetical protein